MTPEVMQAAQAGQPAPAIPPLPSSPGAPTGAAKIVIVDQPGPVVAGGQGGGPTTTTAPPPELPFDPADVVREAMNGAIPILGIILSMFAIMFIGFPLVRAYVRRQDRKLEAGMIKASDVMPQIRQLQESVDAMAVELERISEAQRFQAKLMAEKAPAILPQTQGPRA
jgi:hypothetical protein